MIAPPTHSNMFFVIVHFHAPLRDTCSDTYLKPGWKRCRQLRISILKHNFCVVSDRGFKLTAFKSFGHRWKTLDRIFYTTPVTSIDVFITLRTIVNVLKMRVRRKLDISMAFLKVWDMKIPEVSRDLEIREKNADSQNNQFKLGGSSASTRE